MSNNLNKLFDFQKFAGNARLNAMISETESRMTGRELSEEDLVLVNAAANVPGIARAGMNLKSAKGFDGGMKATGGMNSDVTYTGEQPSTFSDPPFDWQPIND